MGCAVCSDGIVEIHVPSTPLYTDGKNRERRNYASDHSRGLGLNAFRALVGSLEVQVRLDHQDVHRMRSSRHVVVRRTGAVVNGSFLNEGSHHAAEGGCSRRKTSGESTSAPML